MTSASRPDKLFTYRHFDRQIIILCVHEFMDALDAAPDLAGKRVIRSQ
jgi:hypothetical protein